MGFSADLLSRARALKRVVVLPESDDERVLKAASKVLEIDGAKIILLGKKDEILARAGSLDLSKTQFININTNIGDISKLKPTNSNVVSAINVLNNNLNTCTDIALKNKFDLETIVPDVTDNIPADINRLDTKVGDLANLTTDDKSSIVAAINEVKSTGGSGGGGGGGGRTLLFEGELDFSLLEGIATNVNLQGYDTYFMEAKTKNPPTNTNSEV